MSFHNPPQETQVQIWIYLWPGASSTTHLNDSLYILQLLVTTKTENNQSL